MKTIFFLAAFLFSLAALALPNEKVLKNFSNAFPGADSIQWYDGEQEYNVYFIMNGTRCRAWYDQEGNVKKCIRYYGMNNLPPMVLGNIQKKYPGLKIFGVTEYSTPEEFFYQVTLEDDKKWYMVNSDASGNCSLVNKLSKGQP